MRSPARLLALTGLALLSFVGASGCAADTDEAPSESLGQDEAELAKHVRLDRVKPAEVAAAYAEELAPQVSACLAKNPSLQAITTNIAKGLASRPYACAWDVQSLAVGVLAEKNVPSLPASQLAAAIAPYATAVLARAVDADGFYVAPKTGHLDFFYAEKRAREEKALSLAKNPAGVDLRALRAAWRKVEEERGNLDSDWLNPVRVDRDPSLGDVKRAGQMWWGVSQASWGLAAIADFHAADEGPDGSAEFAPIASALKQRSIKKRWYLTGRDSGRGDGWSRNYLVVLDEHQQLWGFQMGYSE